MGLKWDGGTSSLTYVRMFVRLYAIAHCSQQPFTPLDQLAVYLTIVRSVVDKSAK